MNSSSILRNYKHDITGKFKDISMAIFAMNDESFNGPDSAEIFHAVHEVLLKMVKTSKDTMLINSHFEIVLVISDNEPNLKLSKIHVDKLLLRYEIENCSIRYIYSKSENPGSLDTNISFLKTLLPIKKVEFDGDILCLE